MKQILAGGTVVLVGCVFGLVAAQLAGPSNEEIIAGAESLIPKGVKVTERTSGYEGHFPTKGPFRALVDVEGGSSDHSRRVGVFRSNALATDWNLSSVDSFGNALGLSLEKDGLVGQVDVLRSDDRTFISVLEDRREANLRTWIGSLGGAAAGGALWWFIIPKFSSSISRRRARSSQQ